MSILVVERVERAGVESEVEDAYLSMHLHCMGLAGK